TPSRPVPLDRTEFFLTERNENIKRPSPLSTAPRGWRPKPPVCGRSPSAAPHVEPFDVHLFVRARSAVADRHHVAAPDEQMDLTKSDPPIVMSQACCMELPTAAGGH